ncbi:hypothetical protein CDAR_616331 [Caerostris darwini]|uniref:Uncharacterized protein n=1 Tax=Caerostris darwini TaxID=1538125 RepID=A0AAV4PD07_9ARAC|nr:hypothetical protein CDAR_616331 [Caerostris darwini]
MICWYPQMSNVGHSQCRAFVVIRCQNGRYITADSTLRDVLYTGNRCQTTPNVTVQISSNLCRSNSKGFAPFKILFRVLSILRFIVPFPGIIRKIETLSARYSFKLELKVNWDNKL